MKISRTILGAVVLALGLGLVAPTAHAAPPDRRASATFVVGDSVTEQSGRVLKRIHPGWEINGVGGRRVTQLPRVLQRRLARGVAPKRVVIALGSLGDRRWTKQHYRDALALLPPSTRVVFVTLWRDPRFFPEYHVFAKRPSTLRTYSRWMREIAAERPRTCVFEWRRKVKRHPSLLVDGAHPTLLGRKVWAQGVSRAVSGCRGTVAPPASPVMTGYTG